MSSLGTALNTFIQDASGVYDTFTSQVLFYVGGWGITQYTLWMFIALAVVLALVLIGSHRLQLVPTRTSTNILEFGYESIKNSVCRDVIGEGFEKHVPFLMTLFFYILIANFLGLVPGFKTSTGSISVTWALAVISFVYFNFYGFYTLKVGGYIKSLVPQGVPKPMAPIIWCLEFFSLILRVLTLAVRLYGNMLSGHMVLAVFSIATSVFLETAFATGSVVTGLPVVLWFFLLLFMYALETLVAFLQAYVFTILSSSYIGMAIHPH